MRLLLKDVNDKLEEINQQIRAGVAIILKVSEAVKLDWVRQLGNELKAFMPKSFAVNMATYNAIMITRGLVLSHREMPSY